MSKITIETIARDSGVSKGAVSQVLRNPEHPRFSENTRKRILDAANRFGYIPNRVAQGLSLGRTQSLGLIVPWNTPDLFDDAEAEAIRLGFTMTIQSTSQPDVDAEAKALSLALEQRVAGLIWMPSSSLADYGPQLQWMRNSETNVVFLEHAIGDLETADLVRINYEDSMFEALEHMYETGCRSFIYLTRGLDLQMRCSRLKSFESFVAGRPVSGRVFSVDGDVEDRIDTLLREIRSAKEKPGILCDSDWHGLYILRSARRARMSIPKRLHLVVLGDFIVGGNFRVGEVCTPQLNAIRRPSGPMVQHAVRWVVERINGQFSGAGRVKTLPTEYIRRETVVSP